MNIETLSDENKRWYYHFMAHVAKDGEVKREGLTPCWRWPMLSKSSGGYGQITINKKAWNAHRYSWWIHNGCPDIETFKGKHIMHACDNPECSNPEHLSLGTPTENAIEAVERIRKCAPKKEKRAGNYVATAGSFKPGHGAGEANVKAQLTWDDVREIRRRKEAGLKYGELKRMAEDYGIAYVTIQKIVGNQIWKE